MFRMDAEVYEQIPLVRWMALNGIIVCLWSRLFCYYGISHNKNLN